MGLLNELKEKYRAVSIVGMAKNAGKTTALNFLIEEAMDEGMRLGITSTGRDGETTDLVTGTEKPRVYLDEDTLVSVPTELYDLSDAGLEILKMTEYRTSIGRLLLCRVAQSGYVQVAGPVATSQQKTLCSEMLDMGAEMVIIDGAIDRKAIAAPDASDAIIISTGAVISRNMNKVVEETAHMVNLYGLELLEEGTAKDLIEKYASRDKVMFINDGQADFPEISGGLGNSRIMDQAVADGADHIYIPGAFTAGMLHEINPSNLKKVTFVLKDPTRIFVNRGDWARFLKKGMRVKVMENIKVAAVTVNPQAPAGYRFDPEELRDLMQKALPDIPVTDVRI